jgi:hypothetical protein
MLFVAPELTAVFLASLRSAALFTSPPVRARPSVVFASYILTTDGTIKMIGLGMATAIVVDALIIRTVLVAAAMHWLGNANWYLPSWLDRHLPRLDLERLADDPLELEEPTEAAQRPNLTSVTRSSVG